MYIGMAGMLPMPSLLGGDLPSHGYTISNADFRMIGRRRKDREVWKGSLVTPSGI